MPLTFYEVTLDRGIPFAKAQAIQAEWLEKLKALRTEEQRTKEAEQLQEQRRKQREKEERRKLIYAQRKRERDEERAKKRKAAAAKRAQASGKGKGRKVVVEEEEESSSEEELELEIVGDEDEDEEEDAEEEAAKEVWVSPLGLCLDWVPLLIAHMCSIETFVVTSTRLISLFRSKPNQPKAAKKAAEEKAKKDKEEYNDGAGTGFYRCVLVFALRACGRLTDVIVAWRHSTARRPVHARLKPVIPRPSPPLPRRHPPPPQAEGLAGAHRPGAAPQGVGLQEGRHRRLRGLPHGGPLPPRQLQHRLPGALHSAKNLLHLDPWTTVFADGPFVAPLGNVGVGRGR